MNIRYTDPKQLFDQAKEYIQAGDDAYSRGHDYTAEVLQSFACECMMKGLFLRNGINLSTRENRIHDLLHLYSMLPEDVKVRVQSQFSRINLLEGYKLNFENFRYFYDNPNGVKKLIYMKNYMKNFYEALFDAEKHVRPMTTLECNENSSVSVRINKSVKVIYETFPSNELVQAVVFEYDTSKLRLKIGEFANGKRKVVVQALDKGNHKIEAKCNYPILKIKQLNLIIDVRDIPVKERLKIWWNKHIVIRWKKIRKWWSSICK